MCFVYLNSVLNNRKHVKVTLEPVLINKIVRLSFTFVLLFLLAADEQKNSRSSRPTNDQYVHFTEFQFNIFCSFKLVFRYDKHQKSNQIFVIFAILRRSMLQVAEPVSATQRLGDTAVKNVAAVTSRWRRCVRFDLARSRTPDLPHDDDVFHHYASGLKSHKLFYPDEFWKRNSGLSVLLNFEYSDVQPEVYISSTDQPNSICPLCLPELDHQ